MRLNCVFKIHRTSSSLYCLCVQHNTKHCCLCISSFLHDVQETFLWINDPLKIRPGHNPAAFWFGVRGLYSNSPSLSTLFFQGNPFIFSARQRLVRCRGRPYTDPPWGCKALFSKKFRIFSKSRFIGGLSNINGKYYPKINKIRYIFPFCVSE